MQNITRQENNRLRLGRALRARLLGVRDTIMILAKNHHEAFAVFFETPTRDKLRNLLSESIGETDYLDFKSDWPELSKLSKSILAMGNSGGGAIIIGIKELDDGTLDHIGLSKFLDKADVAKTFKKFIPKNLLYTPLDFEYKETEFPSLKGKKFQVLVVESDEKYLPFLALKNGQDIRANTVYVRDGTETVEADREQLEHLINLRIESGYSSTRVLDLAEHLEQLSALMEKSRRNDFGGSTAMWNMLDSYGMDPMSDYYNFIEKMITKKKGIIQKEIEK